MTESIKPLVETWNVSRRKQGESDADWQLRKEQISAIAQDTIIEKMGRRHFRFTAQFRTAEGSVSIKRVDIKGVTRRDAILQLQGMRYFATHLPDKQFAIYFASGTKFQIKKGHTGKYHIWRYNSAITGEDENGDSKNPWQRISIYRMAQPDQIVYPAAAGNLSKPLEFDPDGMLVEGLEAFEPRVGPGWAGKLEKFAKKTIGSMMAGAVGSMPGNMGAGLSKTLGVKTQKDWIDLAVAISKDAGVDREALLKLWGQERELVKADVQEASVEQYRAKKRVYDELGTKSLLGEKQLAAREALEEELFILRHQIGFQSLRQATSDEEQLETLARGREALERLSQGEDVKREVEAIAYEAEYRQYLLEHPGVTLRAKSFWGRVPYEMRRIDVTCASNLDS